MPQSLAKILVHTVFSTKDVRPFLRDNGLLEESHRYLGGGIDATPSELWIVSESPRVASQARQPGAGRWNPVGILTATSRDLFHA